MTMGGYRVRWAMLAAGSAWAFAAMASAQSEQSRGVIVLRATPTPSVSPAPAVPAAPSTATSTATSAPIPAAVATAPKPAVQQPGIAATPALKPVGAAVRPTPTVAPIPAAVPATVKPAPAPAVTAPSAKPVPLAPATLPVRPVANAVTPVATVLPASIVKACPRPFAQPSIALGLTSDFDRRLGRLLKPKPTSLVVDIAQPFRVGTPGPAPLQPWLTQAKASGGLVTVSQYCQDSRGFFGFLKKMFGGSGASRYAAVDGYDAVLHVDGVDQVVTQIEFKRRSAS